MKLLISSLGAAAIAIAALAGSTSAAKPMLRASAVQALQGMPVGMYGNIDSQITLQGQNLTHALNRRERRLVGSCFINSYNDVHATTGYEVYGFRVKMSLYHNKTDRHNGGVVSDVETAVGAISYKNRWPFNGLMAGIDWGCNLCKGRRLAATEALGGANAPPLDDDFVLFFQDCLRTGGYANADEVKIGFFAPSPSTTYLDPLITVSSASSSSSSSSDAFKTPTLKTPTLMTTTITAAATTAVAVNPVANPTIPASPTTTTSSSNSKLSDDSGASSESDIFFYGLTAELSSDDMDRVGECFVTSYNKLFHDSDWNAQFFNVFWQTVIGVGAANLFGPIGTSAKAKAAAAGYGYVLMDVSIDYTCTECNVDDKPDADFSDHNSLENNIFICLLQSKSKAFRDLESVEIRNMLRASTPAKPATAVGVVSATTQSSKAV